ncbi:radical SAM protein [Chloroflexota bacterium]
MTIREIEAKSILRKHKKIDSWFLSRYGMNLYRGCLHNCVYCDGRSEGYYVESEFGEDVTVKTNAIEVLGRELDPKRKRTPFNRGFIIVGGGVGDSYQPIEKKYELTRRTLQLIAKQRLPVHMLTKSTLIERDIDILKRINEETRAIVSFSFSSARDDISRIFEPGVPSPSQRLKTIEQFKSEGISCGMFLLPVIPYVTDTAELIEDTVIKAKDAGVDFVIFGCMTLKEGRQKNHFMNVANKLYLEIASQYRMIYTSSKWGEPAKKYADMVNMRFGSIAKKYRMPVRMPSALFNDLLSENDLAVVLLEHIDFLLRLQGKASSFGYAAYSISQLKEPLSNMKADLKRIKGVGEAAEAIILEILRTGSSSYYEQLMS